MAGEVMAAEKVYLSYGPFERSVSVAALEVYARTGDVQGDLATYIRYADPNQLDQLRDILISPAEINPVAVAQFLYTPQGEILLRRLGRVIQSESRQEGFFAIRAALILAAADREGLTLLNVLRKFPTRGIRIDLEESLDIARALEQAINQTNRVSAAIIEQAEQEANQFTPSLPSQNLFQSGNTPWRVESLTLVDVARRTSLGLPGRSFPADLYIPQTSFPAPVIVISHGLGSDRQTFRYLAEHLASHGFVVAVPEHPGSNATQIQALLNGAASEAAAPEEFVDRPLDISHLLDELERQSRLNPALKGRLNLQRVGVIGQSFGGYTALVLAGAPLNFQQLQTDCNNLDDSLNLSLLLQCRALALPLRDYELSDPRVKAVIAINPVDGSILGQRGIAQIQVPTLIVTGNADTVAPALPEQFRPFTWLNTPNRYLVLMDQGTHFSTLGNSDSDAESIPFPPQVIGPNPAIARRYINALSLAFFQTYIANREIYRNYLSAAYARSISQDTLELSLVRSFTPAQLEQAIASAR